MIGFQIGRRSRRGALSAAIVASVAAAALFGCTQDQGTRIESKEIGGGKALLTTADVRVIMALPKDSGSVHGRNNPREIVCMEPSPDIARAVSSNFGLGASVGLGGLPSGVSADVALSFARARAEAVAQMTERLATIQLLRDGLYRACEAYANGAMSETTYAVLLSRYDDTMITLLLGELAAGNFGRKLAALGGTTSGSSSATLKKAIEDRAAADNADKDVQDAQTKVSDQQKAVADAKNEETRVLGDANASSQDKAQATQKRELEEQKLKTAETELEALQGNALQLQTAATQSSAAAVVGNATGGVAGSNLTAPDRAALAGHLATMQRKYIENINFDAILVACISALDHPNTVLSDALRTKYEDMMAANGKLDIAIAALKDKPANPELIKSKTDAENAAFTKTTEFSITATAGGMSPLGAYCLSGIMPKLMGHASELLKVVLERKQEEKETIKYDNAIDDLMKLDKNLQTLKKQAVP